MSEIPSIDEAVLWAIIASPLVAFALITAYLRKLPKNAGYVSILAIGASLVLSIITLVDVLDADGHVAIHTHEWFQVGALEVNLGVRIDGLTAVMLLVVTMRGLPGAGVFARLYGGRPRVRALLRLYEPLRYVDAGARPR